MRRGRRIFGITLVVWTVVCVLYLVAFKRGILPPRPLLFAMMMALLVGGLLVELVLTVIDLIRRRKAAVIAAGRGLVLCGGLAISGGGFANWLFSLQGFMVLTEGEAMPLFGARHLQGFDAGPLGNPHELHLFLRLGRVRISRRADGRYQPEASLLVERPEEKPQSLVLVAARRTPSGPLFFSGGTFGFSPRIVVLRGKETLFDQLVPFTTERSGPTGYQFAGEFVLERHALALRGEVSLETLDQNMRGHPLLLLEVREKGRSLGSGSLRPGFFADLQGGYRVGFAGLKKWLEIDISRRSYTLPMLAGALALAVGLVVWPIAAWRARRARS